MFPTSIVDLSHPLQSGMTCYPGDPGFSIRCSCNSPISDAPPMVITVHELTCSTHTGTHVDTPFHFFHGGAKLSDIPLERFVGRAVVLDVRHAAHPRKKIGWADVDVECNSAGLRQIGPRSEGKVDIVLLWTGWDTHWDTPTYFAHPYFAREVAERLRDLGVGMVGLDTLNPDETPADASEGGGPGDGFGGHEVLLGAGRLICENLRGLGTLAGDSVSEAWVSIVPLLISGSDGSPVRAYGWRQVKA
ncbi:putative cyclase [Pisolithus microcarpus]|nr:putative cyclase [Pisolithus microcarpus]